MQFLGDEFNQGRILLLYLLDYLKESVSEEQLIRIILDNKWMSYFELQQILVDLRETDMIERIETPEGFFFRRLPQGDQMLSFFGKRLSPAMASKVKIFAEENAQRIQIENQVRADYERLSDNEYVAHCKIIEKDIAIIQLSLNLPSREQARQVCDIWRKQSGEIYSQIIAQFSKYVKKKE